MDRRKKITNIEFAENDRIESLREYVKKVLEALDHPEALVTNESLVWDFTAGKNEFEQVSKKLGCDVNGNDYIWQLAERYKAIKDR